MAWHLHIFQIKNHEVLFFPHPLAKISSLGNWLRHSLSLTWTIEVIIKKNSVAIISSPFQSMCSYNHLSSLAIRFHRSLLFKDKIEFPGLALRPFTIWYKLIFQIIFLLIGFSKIYGPSTIPPLPVQDSTAPRSLTLSLLAGMLLPQSLPLSSSQSV